MSKNNNKELLEIWDWDTGKPTGKPAERTLCHKKGIPHEGVHLWIIKDTPAGLTVLFQLRAPHKKMYPNVLDITVGGHVPFGLQNNKIHKEAYEEIGIILNTEDLIDLGYFKYEEKEKDFFHREFQHVYLLKDNRPLSDYSFIDGEVQALYAVLYNMLKKLMLTDITINAEGYDGNTLDIHILHKKNFHPLLFNDSMKEYMKLLFNSIDTFRE